jgi:O-antigen chain-terminating methyltransferase
MKNPEPQQNLSYLITVSKSHIFPCKMLLNTLLPKTNAKIVLVGNLSENEADDLRRYGVTYLDENTIDMSGRLPNITWHEKYRAWGWYKQQLIRLCIDRFMDTEQVVILDSEVFVFDNWDESSFYDPKTGQPRYFYWISKVRKPDWDYQMYRGAAYLLSFLPECKGIMEYSNSDKYQRHISGVQVFSTKNISRLWQVLDTKTDLQKNIDVLFSCENDLAFSDYDFYGLAVEYGLFDSAIPTVLHNNLLGWYDIHDDINFEPFKKTAMWSMCQRYSEFSPKEYYSYMRDMAKQLGTALPAIPYWTPRDREVIIDEYDNKPGIEYFEKYQKQLDATERIRYSTFYTAVKMLNELGKQNPILVEIGTLRDSSFGGGHFTYKFGEYCSRFGGELHTVDILEDAIRFSKNATHVFSDWIHYYVMDSERFFDEFDTKIDFLYLDGFDSLPGQELMASQKQLNELQKAFSKLSDQCIVLLDDARLPFGGKTALSSQYLQQHGFELIIDSYQQLYYRESIEHLNSGKHKTITKAIVEAQIETSLLSPRLGELILKLPEMYQPIYGHPEISEAVSRESDDRLAEIRKIYFALQDKLGRPLRVLDLGCAQGYISLHLAAEGASVTGVDYLDVNVAVCVALAEEHPDLDVHFETKRIEESLKSISVNQYDMVLGLSVFHHLAHEHGKEVVATWLVDLAGKIECGIFELALASEPLYWAGAQPADPRDLLEGFAFVHEVARHATHLSEIKRPLYYTSKHYWYLDGMLGEFDSWTYFSHHLVGNFHNKTRQYFFGNGLIVKKFLLEPILADYNRAEIKRESEFLARPLSGFRVPQLTTFGENQAEAWLVREAPVGEILSSIIANGQQYDAYRVLGDVLEQLCALEIARLFHGDVRIWNILIVPDGSAVLIDYGSISENCEDSGWPHNIFLAFWIFVREVVTGVIKPTFPQRQPFISPLTFPEPYRQWGMRVWSSKPDQWSFKLLWDEFKNMKNPKRKTVSQKALESKENGTVLWMQAMEEYTNTLNTSIRNMGADSEGARLDLQGLRADLEKVRNERDGLWDSLNDVLTDRERIRKQVDEVRGDRERIQKQLDEVRGDRERIQKQLDEVWGDRDLVLADRERIQKQLDEVFSDRHRIWVELGQVWTDRDRVQAELHKVYSSRSYRITAPMRAVFGTARIIRDYFIKPESPPEAKTAPSLKERVKGFLRTEVNYLRKNPFVGIQLYRFKTRFPRLWTRVAVWVKDTVREEQETFTPEQLGLAGSPLSVDEKHFLDLFERELAQRQLKKPEGE